MDYIIRFTHSHETFRLAEIRALAELYAIPLEVLRYSPDSPFCVVRVPSADAAKKLVERSILVQHIHELWGSGDTLAALHENVRSRSTHLWPIYAQSSFKFTVDSFQGTRSSEARVALIDSFDYMALYGPICMADPDEKFVVLEDWPPQSHARGITEPSELHLGRWLGGGARDLVRTFDLKKRRYISTTSMDAELALVTANLALARPGGLVYDPFVGTGSFPLACAQFGAAAWGSDIDGRSFRGEGTGGRSLRGNFEQYGLEGLVGDVFAADLTNSPVRLRRLFDAVVCDPPYGVREGLRVLGLRDPEKTPWLVESGIKKWRDPDYVPPKKPYGFLTMLDDILVFAAATLVDRGRLSFWMPTASDEEQEFPIPSHPCLELVSVCVQVFCKWSRRLITYRRIPDAEVSPETLTSYQRSDPLAGTTADELNPFRATYFKKSER